MICAANFSVKVSALFGWSAKETENFQTKFNEKLLKLHFVKNQLGSSRYSLILQQQNPTFFQFQ